MKLVLLEVPTFDTHTQLHKIANLAKLAKRPSGQMCQLGFGRRVPPHRPGREPPCWRKRADLTGYPWYPCPIPLYSILFTYPVR